MVEIEDMQQTLTDGLGSSVPELPVSSKQKSFDRDVR